MFPTMSLTFDYVELIVKNQKHCWLEFQKHIICNNTNLYKKPIYYVWTLGRLANKIYIYFECSFITLLVLFYQVTV